MDKKEYYRISKSEKLPKRCPLLGKCFRRIYTIYFFSYWELYGNNDDNNIVVLLTKEGEIYNDFEKTSIRLQGESPVFSKGKDLLYFENMCPEFANGKLLKTKVSSERIPISKLLRFEVFQRDDFTCRYCGRNKDDGIKLEIDHRIPLSRNGTDELNNLITACSDCNSGKSNKIIKRAAFI